MQIRRYKGIKNAVSVAVVLIEIQMNKLMMTADSIMACSTAMRTFNTRQHVVVVDNSSTGHLVLEHLSQLGFSLV